MQVTSALLGLSPQNVFLKKFLIFFPKKSARKKFLIFSQKSFSNFLETELSYIFLKKVYSYIPGKVYSEPCYIKKSVKHLLWNVLKKKK